MKMVSNGCLVATIPPAYPEKLRADQVMKQLNPRVLKLGKEAETGNLVNISDAKGLKRRDSNG